MKDVGKGFLSRREFLKRASGAGLFLYLAGSWLSRPSSAFAQVEDMPQDLLAAVAAEQSSNPGLNIFNWSYYIAEDPVTEEEFGVDLTDVTPTIEKFQEFTRSVFGQPIGVTYDTFESQEEMLAKVRPGGSGYDVVVFTQYYVPMGVELGLIRPLNKDWLPNLSNIMKRFKKEPFNPRPDYIVPYMWGVTGYAYNEKYVQGDPRVGSLSLILLGHKYRGRITMFESIAFDGVSDGLKLLGYSINESDREALLTAGDLLRLQKPWVKAYISGPVRDQLVTEDVWIAQLWGGDTLYAQGQNPAVQFAMPREGSDVWLDSMTVLTESKRPATAHLWMNYILRPRVNAGIATWVAYATPNEAALEFIPEDQRTSHIIYPTDEDLKNYEVFLLPKGEAWEIRQKIEEELLGG